MICLGESRPSGMRMSFCIEKIENPYTKEISRNDPRKVRKLCVLEETLSLQLSIGTTVAKA